MGMCTESQSVKWNVCFARLSGWEGCECVNYDMTLIGVCFVL